MPKIEKHEETDEFLSMSGPSTEVVNGEGPETDPQEETDQVMDDEYTSLTARGTLVKLSQSTLIQVTA